MIDDNVVMDYIRACERAVATAFENEGLAGHLLRGWQGPTMITYRVSPHRPTAQIIRRILAMAHTIEALVQSDPVRIYSQAGVIHIEIPSPFPWRVSGSGLPALAGRRLAAPLGMTGQRAGDGKLTVEYVDFGDPGSAHIIVVGPTGGGKTTALQLVLYHLCRNLSAGRLGLIVFADPSKRHRWQEVQRMPHCEALILAPGEARAALDWVQAEVIPRRGGGREWILVLDDLLNLLEAGDIVQPLAQIASIGRESRVHLLIGSQRLGSRGAGDAAVSGNITTRLVARTADANDSHLFTGQRDAGAEQLSRGHGDMLLVRGGQVLRLAVSKVDDADWRALRAQRGWLPRTGALAPWCRQDGAGGSVTAVTTGSASQARPEIAAAAEYAPRDVPEPVTEPVTGAPVTSARILAFPLANQLTTEEKALLESVQLPLRRIPPGQLELRVIQVLYRATGSKNQTVRAAYRGKNTRYLHWVDMALAGAGASEN